ncbi:HrpE/YscL family type III secretion apparatus protein [Pseudomonas canadensis]|uniref:HrpE/YscL family type III secretion apparatus protein n=1 Tax=Pseudomonas canadensis TaxID=915099 RepID=UPI002B247DD5|nr:HrpE/YscL family type III secretion apparatus protein [Pseudomonas canadensis]MEB2645709.1 HrpE/YscL family type III secretion apparatus protein [Pseudomonas canadensis]
MSEHLGWAQWWARPWRSAHDDWRTLGDPVINALCLIDAPVNCTVEGITPGLPPAPHPTLLKLALASASELDFVLDLLDSICRPQNEQKALSDNLERYITGVVNQAIRHLLDETPQPQRLAALLKQLLASQVPGVNALLLCHPREIEALKHCLSRHDAARWRLQPDDTISTQTLVLKTDEGDFHINWASMLAPFSKEGDQAPLAGLAQSTWN